MDILILIIIIPCLIFIIGFPILYIFIRFWGYVLGNIRYYAECRYYKNKRMYGNPEN